MFHRLALLALGVAFVASCTTGPGPSTDGQTADEFEKTTVTTTTPIAIAADAIVVVGPVGDGADAGATGRALATFAEASGIDVRYLEVDEGTREFSRRLSRDEPGDIFLVDSVPVIVDAANRRVIRPIPRDVDAEVGRSWTPAWTSQVRVGDLLYGAPVEAGTDSLLWYQPARFAAAGYRLPTTWDELVEVAAEMIDDESVPFCGFVEEPERSRTFVDWTFDLLLRSHDLSVYDALLSANGGVDFDDPDVIEVWREVLGLWVSDEVGFDVVEGLDESSEVADPMVDFVSGRCALLRGGIELAGAFPPGTRFADGTDAAVDVLVFPGPRGNHPLIADVTYAVSRRDTAEAWAVMQYLGSGQFARDRRATQSDQAATNPVFLTAASDQDLFQLSLLELSLIDVMTRATEVREGWDELVTTFGRVSLIAQARLLLAGETNVERALDTVVKQ